MRWRHQIITPATAEVLSLEDAKAELDVTFNDDDALISGHIASAIGVVQDYTNRFLAPTLVELQMDGFLGPISFPFAPVISISALSYLDGAGTLSSIMDYRSVEGEPWVVMPAIGAGWPYAKPELASVRLRALVGYPEGQVPPGLLQAVKLALRAFYEVPAGAALEAELNAVRSVASPYRFLYL